VAPRRSRPRRISLPLHLSALLFKADPIIRPAPYHWVDCWGWATRAHCESLQFFSSTAPTQRIGPKQPSKPIASPSRAYVNDFKSAAGGALIPILVTQPDVCCRTIHANGVCVAMRFGLGTAKTWAGRSTPPRRQPRTRGNHSTPRSNAPNAKRERCVRVEGHSQTDARRRNVQTPAPMGTTNNSSIRMHKRSLPALLHAIGFSEDAGSFFAHRMIKERANRRQRRAVVNSGAGGASA